MFKIIHLLAAVLLVNNIFCQAISVGFGPIFTKTNAIVPVVNGKEDFSNTDYTFLFSYEHFLKDSKSSLFASYSKYNGCTFILFEPGGWISGGGDALGKGFCYGIKLHRFDLNYSYSVTEKGKKFYFKPHAGLGLQLSRKTKWEFGLPGLPIDGPNYFELAPMEATPINTTQLVPTLGFRTGFVFWKRLDVGVNFQGVYAFKAYQKMYFAYQYKGVTQPMAEYESTGTGLFVTFGMGFRFK
jgi:hypothetical protein